jgi:hypothetical protein
MVILRGIAMLRKKRTGFSLRISLSFHGVSHVPWDVVCGYTPTENIGSFGSFLYRRLTASPR